MFRNAFRSAACSGDDSEGHSSSDVGDISACNYVLISCTARAAAVMQDALGDVNNEGARKKGAKQATQIGTKIPKTVLPWHVPCFTASLQ